MPWNRADNKSKCPKTIAHRAGWIVADPQTIISDGVIVVENDRIIAVEKGQGKTSADQVVDHGPGALIPAWVNAHTHLELTVLKDKTRQDAGFLNWVQSLIELRETISEKTLLDAAADAIERLVENGTGLIGEISTFGLTCDIFQKSAIAGICFIEYLGPIFTAPAGNCGSTGERRVSVAGHAPHTTTAEVLLQLKEYSRKNKCLFAIHLAESSEEQDFITSGEGRWSAFLQSRGIDPKQWKTVGDSPVRYCDRLGIIDDQTLAVHLVFADAADIRLLADRGSRLCLCPRSNMQLHGQLPDLPRILSAGLCPALGTDSLASNETLDMQDEISFTACHFPGVSPAQILAMATAYGADALGFGDCFGRLQPGKKAWMQYRDISARNPEALLAGIIGGEALPAIAIHPAQD